MSDITLNDFKKNLDAGKYKSIAGGRRGVGKIQGWDDATRDQARKLVDKHFGAVGVVPTPKAAKPQAPKAKAAAKPAATATGKRRGRPPGSGKKQAAAPAGPGVKAAAKPKAAPKVAAQPVKRARRVQATGEKSISDMTLVVGSISEALRAIKMCRELTTKPADLDPEALAAGRILGSVVQALGQAVVPTLMSEGSTEATSAPAVVRRRGPRKQEETMPVNGLSNPSDETPGEEPAADQAS